MFVENFVRCLLPVRATVKEAVENLTISGLLVALVVDSEERLIGVVCDGDVRRGLLAGADLDSPVTRIMNESFVSAPFGTAQAAAERISRKEKVSHVPLVDQRGRVTRLFVDDINPLLGTQPNAVVIMAGGLGSRLSPLTQSTPKPLVTVGGKPMMQHIVENFRAEGFHRLFVSVHHLAAQIEEYFGDGSDFGVEITYLRESSPLGTAGSLSLITENLSAPFFVINGDVFVTVRMSEMLEYHVNMSSRITVGVTMVENQSPYGVVEIDGARVVGLQEKPVRRDFANAGIYVVNPTVLGNLQVGERTDMTDLILAELPSAGVSAFPIHEDWIDLGRPEDLARAAEKFKSKQGDSNGTD